MDCEELGYAQVDLNAVSYQIPTICPSLSARTFLFTCGEITYKTCEQCTHWTFIVFLGSFPLGGGGGGG